MKKKKRIIKFEITTEPQLSINGATAQAVIQLSNHETENQKMIYTILEKNKSPSWIKPLY